MASLAEYAEQREPRCKVCHLPPEIRKEVDQGLRDGIGPAAVSGWLGERGHDINPSRVGHHRRAGHLE